MGEENTKAKYSLESLMAKTAQIDEKAFGTIPDDPKEAYMRGIKAGLTTGNLLIIMGYE